MVDRKKSGQFGKKHRTNIQDPGGKKKNTELQCRVLTDDKNEWVKKAQTHPDEKKRTLAHYTVTNNNLACDDSIESELINLDRWIEVTKKSITNGTNSDSQLATGQMKFMESYRSVLLKRQKAKK